MPVRIIEVCLCNFTLVISQMLIVIPRNHCREPEPKELRLQKAIKVWQLYHYQQSECSDTGAFDF